MKSLNSLPRAAVPVAKAPPANKPKSLMPASMPRPKKAFKKIGKLTPAAAARVRTKAQQILGSSHGDGALQD